MGKKSELPIGQQKLYMRIAVGVVVVVGVLFLMRSASGTNPVQKQMLDEYRQELTQLRQRLSRLEEQANQPSSSASSSASSASGSVSFSSPTSPKSPKPLPGLFAAEGTSDPRVDAIYGGVGDAVHLGGFTQNDTMGQSPALWMWMVKTLNVRTFMDIGCGRGISTKWFQDHNVDVLCVEGSNDALKRTLLNRSDIVQHDYSRGQWWPEKTYDVLWAVEFLEHVGRHYMKNYFPTFDKAALLFLTHSQNGGYHHVEVHHSWWWKAKFQAHGYVFSQELTTMVQAISRISNLDGISAQHLWATMQVYINPKIATLPKHSHLFGGPGCYTKAKGTFQCEGADKLLAQFLPVYSQDYKHDETTAQVERGIATRSESALRVVKKDYSPDGRIGPVEPEH